MAPESCGEESVVLNLSSLHDELMVHLQVLSRGLSELGNGYERACVVCLGGCGARGQEDFTPSAASADSRSGAATPPTATTQPPAGAAVAL